MKVTVILEDGKEKRWTTLELPEDDIGLAFGRKVDAANHLLREACASVLLEYTKLPGVFQSLQGPHVNEDGSPPAGHLDLLTEYGRKRFGPYGEAQ